LPTGRQVCAYIGIVTNYTNKKADKHISGIIDKISYEELI